MQTFLWIFNYVKKIKLLYTMAIIMLTISVIANILITYSQKLVVDKLFVEKRYELFAEILLFFIIVVITYIVTWCFRNILFERALDRIRYYMRRDYMAYLYRMEVKKFQNERIGSLVSYINEFIKSKIAFWSIAGLFEQLLNLTLLLIIVGAAIPKLLIFIAPISLIYIWQGRYFTKRMQSLSIEQNEAKANHQMNIEEGISSTREIIAFHQMEWERNKLKSSFSNFMDKIWTVIRLQRKQLIVTEPLRWGTNLLILGYGGYEVIQGSISIGTFLIFYQFSIQLIDSVHGAYSSVLELTTSYGGLNKAKKMIEGEKIIEGTHCLESNKRIDIRFEKITFAYSKEQQSPILNELSITIPAGSKVAIVGKSGSGKSTLAQLLLRFYEPNEGCIYINDIPLPQITRESWSANLAVVLQEPFLFPDTIRTNILMGRSFSEAGLIEVCKQTEIYETILAMPMQFDTILGERGITLSGGQRQRIALARALLGQPNLLILDEASSALDPETERKIQRNIDSLRKGKTTIVIAHRLSTIENSDKIFIMANGKLVDAGTHEELLHRSDDYIELFHASIH